MLSSDVSSEEEGANEKNGTGGAALLKVSIVQHERHLRLDARSLPWMTREIKREYKALRSSFQEKFHVIMWYSSDKEETLKVKEQVLLAPHATTTILIWPSVIVGSSMYVPVRLAKKQRYLDLCTYPYVLPRGLLRQGVKIKLPLRSLLGCSNKIRNRLTHLERK
jgi:hypothetical protein